MSPLKTQKQEKGTKIWGRHGDSMFRAEGRRVWQRVDAKPVTVGLQRIRPNIY